MKKRNKLFVSLLASLSLVGSVSSVVHAEVNPTEVVTKIQEVENSLSGIHGKGFISLSIAANGQNADIGQVNFELKANKTESASFIADFVSPFIGEKMEAGFFIKDKKMTIVFPGHVSSTEVESFSDGIPTPVNPEETLKTMNVTETDSEYILTLREDLDIDAMWEELAKDGQIEQMKAQVILKLEQQGQEVDEMMRQIIDRMLSKEFFQFAAKEIKPKFEFHYTKDSHYIKRAIGEVSIEPASLVSFLVEEELPAEVLVDLPEQINIKFEAEFDGHNEPQDIAAPEVKIN